MDLLREGQHKFLMDLLLQHLSQRRTAQVSKNNKHLPVTNTDANILSNS